MTERELAEVEDWKTKFDRLPAANQLFVLACVAHMSGDTDNFTFPKAVIKKAAHMCRVTLGNPKADAEAKEYAEHAIAYIREHVKPE